ncbi:MAG: 3-deoxy-manno-octulosonate cytidylyltransferase [Ignavibacteria bacterium]|nr:3-deoxy-manno-octulosonate cytidylyltransferase [Ignavibacteria bacterium]
MKTVAVIPARYGSTRFPGKPLAIINGKPMVQRVYEQCAKAKLVDRIIVATEDKRIIECVESFGGEAIMTSSKHHSGTDRVIEVVKDMRCDIVVNVQGDEPFIDPLSIDKVIKPFSEDKSVQVATPAVKFKNMNDVRDPNKVKVIVDKNGDAIYFSRSPIPYDGYDMKFSYLKHIGIYSFRKKFLLSFGALKKTPLELKEKLEQLRIIENGYKIRVVMIGKDSIAIDTPDDIRRALANG